MCKHFSGEETILAEVSEILMIIGRKALETSFLPKIFQYLEKMAEKHLRSIIAWKFKEQLLVRIIWLWSDPTIFEVA